MVKYKVKFRDDEEKERFAGMANNIIKMRYGGLPESRRDDVLFSMAVIAKCLCLEERQVRSAIDAYFRNKKPKKNRKLTPSMLTYLINRKNLRE